MIGLTGDEQLKALGKVRRRALDDGVTPDRAQEDDALLRAQLKKVVEWRNEECTEHSHTINISGIDHRVIVMHNDCEECWQNILEEC